MLKIGVSLPAISLLSPILGQTVAGAAQQRLDRTFARRLLHDARSWGVQYQNVDISILVESPLDLIVLDPSLNDSAGRFISAQEMAALKRKPDGGRRLVIGYLCIGEADLKRWYWPPQWRSRLPAWVGPENINWPGSRVVRYWDRRWQEMIVTGSASILSKIIDLGFDGVLLDRVDAYGDWDHNRTSARQEMIELVEKVAKTARQRHSGFLLIPQNAEHIIENESYRAVIDAINKESLLTGLSGKDIPNRATDVEWSLSRLRLGQAAGVRMLATEYLSNPNLRDRTNDQLVAWNFLPFFGVKALDKPPW
ncbi:hypothetical protein IP69_14610 [Bosea sp. AAP35]|nr:hypothetical protein IP69_14610 [Bosea sp. AAP35]